MLSEKYVVIVINLFLITFGIGCASMDWQSTLSLNTIESYEDFLKKHPKGEFSEQADNKLKFLYNVEMMKAENILEYEEFLKRHPNSKIADEERTRLANIRAKLNNMRKTANQFLKGKPMEVESLPGSDELKRKRGTLLKKNTLQLV